MKKMSLTYIALVCGLVVGGIGQLRAEEIVVNFDDLVGLFGVVPQGYGGIEWNGNWDYYPADQSPYTPASGSDRVFTDYSLPVATMYGENTFQFSAPTVFDGAYFSGFSFLGPVSFNLYLGGNLVGTSSSLAPTETPTFLSSGYSGLVDTVGVVGGNDYYVMDNVTYQSAVPEPSAFALLGLGGIGLAFGAYRRRQAAAV